MPHHQGSANHNAMLPNVAPSVSDDSVLPGAYYTPLNQKNTLFTAKHQFSLARGVWLVTRGGMYS